MTEFERIKQILMDRGVIENNTFNETRFRKLVTEPWIYAKTLQYQLNKNAAVEQKTIIDEVIEETETIVEETETTKEEVKAVEETETTKEEVKAVEETETTKEEVKAVEETVVETEVVEETVVEAEVVEETTKKKSSKKK